MSNQPPTGPPEGWEPRPQPGWGAPQPPQPPRAARPWYGRWWAIVGGILLALIMIGAFALSAFSGNERYTITGQLTARTSETFVLDGCHASGGFSDLEPGTAVTVRDEAGNIIGNGKLDNGEQMRNGIVDAGCRWNFSLSVPKADFYAFEIGRREGVTKSFGEMESDDWRIGLEI
jgi:hypothetical protein